MADIPEAMLTKERKPDPHFADDEELFRRFNPDDLDGTRVATDAIELPDMSMNRSKYGPAAWLLLDEDFQHWGVFAVKVGDLPRELLHLGQFRYTFEPRHVPLKYNYPHSEVWAFLEGVHIDLKNESLLDHEAHQCWRQLLVWKTRIAISPRETQ
jgi:hypothetical protein